MSLSGLAREALGGATNSSFPRVNQFSNLDNGLRVIFSPISLRQSTPTMSQKKNEIAKSQVIHHLPKKNQKKNSYVTVLRNRP